MADEQRPQHVVLIRHGATDWSDAKRHTGWADVPLNERGLRQGATLAPELLGWRFSAILCSPLERAVATARAAGFLDGVQLDPDLREWNYGNAEGLTSAEMRKHRPGWTLWRDGVEGGESLGDVAARADRVVARLRALDGDVAVFAHGHLLRVLAARWIGAEPSLAQYLSLDTAAISMLGWEHDWPSITLWNRTAS